MKHAIATAYRYSATEVVAAGEDGVAVTVVAAIGQIRRSAEDKDIDIVPKIQ